MCLLRRKPTTAAILAQAILAQRSADCFGGVCTKLWFGFSCLFTNTDHNAQGMDEGTSVGWLGANRHWPAPKVERWPHANPTSRSAKHNASRRDVQSGDPNLQARQPSRPPEKVAMEANEEVRKLEAAVAALGGENSAHAKTSARCFEDGKSPERKESRRKFIERAKKRVRRAEEPITKATEQKAAFLLEEERLKQLESEAAAPAALSEPVVADLQRQIDALILERDCLRGMHKAMPGVWCGDGPPNLEAIPPMPTSDLQDLEMWLSNRNCELRNALEFRDTATIAKVGALVGQGHRSTHVIRDGGANGRHNEVTTDGCVDRFSGREETMLALQIQVVRFHLQSGTKSERSQAWVARRPCWGGVESGTAVSGPATLWRRSC